MTFPASLARPARPRRRLGRTWIPLAAAALATAFASVARATPTPTQKCQAAKLKLAGKKASCEFGIAAKGLADFTRCSAAFAKSFSRLSPCSGDQQSLEDRVDAFRAQIASALTPVGNKCEVKKIKATAKKESCKVAVEAKTILTGTPPDFTKCEGRFASAFAKLDAPAAGCPVTGDAGPIEGDVDDFVAGARDEVTGATTSTSTTTTTSTTVPLVLLVLRVGDGSIPLDGNDTAQPVFIEERSLSGAPVLAPGNPIAMPTVGSGSNRAFTLSGDSDTEGGLARSVDGHYVTLVGYDAPPGTPMVKQHSTGEVNRVVARIDALLDVDTSTIFTTAFSGDHVRSAVSVDGSRMWVTGASAGNTGGVWTLGFAQVGGTQLLDDPDKLRRVVIAGGNLFGCSGQNGVGTMFGIGSGLPITGGQTATALPGTNAGVGSPFDFVFLDRNPSVPGLDTMYVADDRDPPAGGIQKWTFDGTTWTLVATFSAGLPAGLHGLVVADAGQSVTLVGTTSEPSANHMVVLVDDGSPSPLASVVATTATGTFFHGVTIAPH